MIVCRSKAYETYDSEKHTDRFTISKFSTFLIISLAHLCVCKKLSSQCIFQFSLCKGCKLHMSLTFLENNITFTQHFCVQTQRLDLIAWRQHWLQNYLTVRTLNLTAYSDLNSEIFILTYFVVFNDILKNWIIQLNFLQKLWLLVKVCNKSDWIVCKFLPWMLPGIYSIFFCQIFDC